mgnify:CR=1 FL=1
MIEVIPAIIPKTFDELCHKLSLVSGVISTVQIDILDGKFTPYKTWPNILNPDSDFVKIIREEEAFPYSEDLEFEVHLMVSDPVSFFQPWVSAGAKRVIVHVESFENTEKAKQCIESFYNQYGGDGSFLGVELTLAIKIDTPLSSVAELIPLVDSVQCMGIAEIGVQGQPFDDRTLSLIENIHQEYPEKIISVDGGINVNTAKRVVGVGATRLVVGSALFESADMLGTIETLENLV